MESLLDFTSNPGPAFITTLDQTVRLVSNPTSPAEFKKASEVLVKLKDHPQGWTRVALILEKSQYMNSKFFALQILELAITTRWKVLPRPEQEGIKKYLVKKIIELSRDERTLHQSRTLVSKMNNTLVQVLKQEWPAKWPGFITDIVESSKGSESLCENNVHILKLLSEEVFDFAKDQMTSEKTHQLEKQLNTEFSKIFELLNVILTRSKRPSLLSVTLKTLLRFLSWVPLEYIFKTDLIKTLLTIFFPAPQFRNDALACLTEIAGLKNPDVQRLYSDVLRSLFVFTITQLARIHLPPSTDIPRAVERGSEDDRHFVRGLSLFCTTFLSQHLQLVEGTERPTGNVTCRETLMQTLAYLVQISAVDDKEIFKICIEFWNQMTKEVYLESCRLATSRSHGGSVLSLAGSAGAAAGRSRADMYSQVFSKVRLMMITKMAKPEEVLIEQDERGEIVRQATKDTDAIALYKTMRETIVYLTHLDYEDAEQIMLDKLHKQVNGTEWSWNNLNRLCWAIGSISLTMSEEDEKRFLVTVIKDLLGLCEAKRGKDNKAVIASNIMYVVGQYPRFLKAHWRFLKTVVNKLFEFMHELHPGVQDMACDTFLKISKKCKHKFVEKQANERVPHIEELLANLASIISELETHQVHVFYEAVGYMVGAERDVTRRKELLLQAMSIPNQYWTHLMRAAAQNVETLKEPAQVKRVSKILRTNISVCRSLGHPYVDYLGLIYNDMLNVYKMYSEHVAMAVAKSGKAAMHDTTVRLMRAAKKEALQLIEVFVERSSEKHAAHVAEMFLPPLLNPVLADYQRAIEDARDPEVLSLLTTMVNKLKSHMNRHVPVVMKAVFEVTFKMLAGNFEDHPEIRHNFFALLKAIVTHCFGAIFKIPPEYQRAVVSAIVGAMKHTERIVAEMGLDILLKFLQHLQGHHQIAQLFYKTFFMDLVQNVLVVLTDRLHKSGFSKQATILQYMFGLVESGKIVAPLVPGVAPVAAGVSCAAQNKKCVVQFVMRTLSTMFPKMNPTRIQHFVAGLCDVSKTLPEFKQFLHDFLVETKEWSKEDNTDMFYAEQQKQLADKKKAEQQQKLQIPGLLNPHELPDDMDDI